MKSANLTLHCGASRVERSALSAVALPEVTRSYAPVGHDALINLIEDKIQDIGFRFGEQEHALTREGNRYFGMVRLMNGADTDQHALIMGVRNSYDKAFAATILFGAYVFLCDNLSYSAEVVIGRKHTTNILRDLPGLVTAGLGQTKAFASMQTERFEHYQSTVLESDRTANHLMVNMLRRQVIQTSRFERMVQEWHEPSVDHGPKTAWRLFNACTEALKGTPAMDMPRRTIELQAIMDDYTYFNPNAAKLALAV